MSNIPADLLYAKSHEWLKVSADGTALVGITDYAQSSLGDITFVQLPKAGAVFAAGAAFGVVESVKAASDLYAPAAFTVIESNAALDAAPEALNTAPYDTAWMLKVKLASPAIEGLLDADAYAKHIG
ncbi:MAG: glycine cleavage system protein GcvH [Burkholderiales bacterium]|nr:glycine cleavage system protein GcvH [Opitutaceae bacterium]